MITVSPKITVTGDKVVAAAYLRAARYELFKLEQYMGFNSLDQGSRGPIVVSADGVTVEVEKRFGDRFINIVVPEGVGGGAPTKTICLCNCNLSVGWVVREQEDTIDGAKLYTVMACNFKRSYVRYTDVLASDWAVYKPSQKILLAPYYMMNFLCCESPNMDYGSTSGFGCRAEISQEQKDSEDWRTAYRILPYMGRLLPLEVEVHND